MKPDVQRHEFDADLLAEIEKISANDNYHALIAIAADYGVIAAAIAAKVAFGWVVYPLCVLVIGSRQRALATIVHEASHNALARNKVLSLILATLFSGYLIFSTFHAYKASHVVGHHGNFGHPELDGDYRFMLEKGIYDIKDEKRFAWEILIKPFLLANVPSYLAYLAKHRLLSTRNNAARLENVLLIALWSVIISVALAFGQGFNLVLFWIVPLLTSFQIIGWFIELAEHGPLMQTGLNLHMTRNRHSHWLEHFFTGMHGENYHLAHHLRPRVPFWRMKALHEILMGDSAYREWDSRCGGIFLSSNNAPSVVSILMNQCRQRMVLDM